MQPTYRREILLALREDRAWRDVTSKTFIEADQMAEGRVVAKADGVVAGAAAAGEVFRLRDGRCRVKIRRADGRVVRRGQTVLEVRGPLRSLLAAERTALNVLTHLSGIATLTRQFVHRADKAAVLDTRKTLPGLRDMQKWAVLCGGGKNHRRDLSDAVLIKENHLSLVRNEQDLAVLFRKIRGLRRRGLPVEMECQESKHVLWGLLSGADILLLDNVPLKRLPRLVASIKRQCRKYGLRRPLLEVSGGVTLDAVRSIARAGVDRISVGRLTHSAPALDMSLDVRLL